MRQALSNFFLASWPHAVLGTALMLIAVTQDSPVAMLLGAWSTVIAILNYEDRLQ